MIAEFEELENEEVELLLQAPLLVSILIAGADGKIDNSELHEAVSLAKLKQTKARKDLIEYYSEVSEDFEDKLKFLINNLPMGPEARNTKIVQELAKLSDILPKLPAHFARELFASLKDFAKKIAEASGGILGYMSVGYEESKYIELKMIKNPSNS